MAEQHHADQRDAALSAPLTTNRRTFSYNLVDGIKSFIHNVFPMPHNKEMKNGKPIKASKNGHLPHAEQDLRSEDFNPLLQSLDRMEANLTEADDALRDAGDTIERLLAHARDERKAQTDKSSR